MTNSIASLECLASLQGPESEEALESFYTRARDNKEALVINKWLQVQASADVPNAVEVVRSLLTHEVSHASQLNNGSKIIIIEDTPPNKCFPKLSKSYF